MNAIKRLFFFALFLIVGCATNSDERATAGDQEATVPGQKLVIAHRGASGYLPEHTLAAKAMAYAQGADYIEQDLVMTKDGEIVVLHDHYLDTVTDVRHVFPERRRDDGRYYVIDFTLEEVKQLSVSERFKSDGGAETAGRLTNRQTAQLVGEPVRIRIQANAQNRRRKVLRAIQFRGEGHTRR